MMFNDVLRQLRTDSGMSQEELAKRLGLAKSTISMYESGSREPSLEILEAIPPSPPEPHFWVRLYFFGLNAEKWLKIWANYDLITICSRFKQCQAESAKINKSTQNLHS